MFAGNWLLVFVTEEDQYELGHTVHVCHDHDGEYEDGKEYALPDGKRGVVRGIFPDDSSIGRLLSQLYAMKGADEDANPWRDFQLLLFLIRGLGEQDEHARAEHEQAQKAAREEEAMKVTHNSLIALEQKVDALGRDIQEREAAHRAELKERDWTISCLRHKSQPKVSEKVTKALARAANEIYKGKPKKGKKK